MSYKILEERPGYKEVMHFDAKGEGVHVIETFHDYGAALRQAEMIRQTQRKASDDMRHEAIIPPHRFEAALRDGYFKDDAYWNKWLHTDEGKAHRVANIKKFIHGI